MELWKFQPQGDGRITRLLHGERVVLVIDETHLELNDCVGVRGRSASFGAGKAPSWEDGKAIVAALNAAEQKGGTT